MFAEEMAARAVGKRGKYAEDEVRKYLERINREVVAFDWHRVLDARSAGGRFPAQTGDFAFFAPRLHGVIEVKEVAHDYRLPSKNFNVKQINRLRKRALAGGLVVVLIRHSTSKVWRRVPLPFFVERLNAPSWDLGAFEATEDLASLLEDVRDGVLL